MSSPEDSMLDLSLFENHAVELLLELLSDANEPAHITVFGSARIVATAFNRSPKTLLDKVAWIHLNAGASSPDFLEWNTNLDPNAVVTLLRSELPVALYPCATSTGPFSLGRFNTYWQLESLDWVSTMQPRLRRYLAYALRRENRVDFLRALEDPLSNEEIRAATSRSHHVWETATWANIAGLKLVRRPDGTHRLLTKANASDEVLPFSPRPCDATVQPDGRYSFHTEQQRTNRRVIDRGDPKLNQAALREALPALYQSFRV